MSRFALRKCLLAGGVFAALALVAGASAQTASPPDLSAPWVHPPGGEFPAVDGSPVPMRQDPKHPFITPQTTFRIGDLSNPNLKQWAKDAMKKDSDEIDAGKIAFTARSSCLPAGVPEFDMFGGPPIYIMQTQKEVVMLYEGDSQVRRVYLNVPHSANVKPSWYGESVGHYEGDTLVVDTIGQNTKTVVDGYRTPHSEKLHVVERWHVIDGGKTMEVNITVDDPDTFNQPWSTFQRYNRGSQTFSEDICAENNTIIFDYHMPVAEKPDF